MIRMFSLHCSCSPFHEMKRSGHPRSSSPPATRHLAEMCETRLCRGTSTRDAHSILPPTVFTSISSLDSEPAQPTRTSHPAQMDSSPSNIPAPFTDFEKKPLRVLGDTNFRNSRVQAKLSIT